MRSRALDYQKKLRDLLVEFALPKFVDGTFKVPIEREFSWENIQEAHALIESSQSKEKIIYHVD